MDDELRETDAQDLTDEALDLSEIEEPPATKWPKVIGIISLIYACIGLVGVTCSGASIVVLPLLPEALRAGMEMPPIVRFTGAVQVILTLGLGILMLAGAIKLLRRRRSGVGLLKKWAVLRIVLLLLSVVVAILTGPAQVQMARQRLDFANRAYEESGRADRVTHKTDDQLWRQVMMQSAIMSGVVAVYPFFLGFYLSRRKLADEVEAWV